MNIHGILPAITIAVLGAAVIAARAAERPAAEAAPTCRLAGIPVPGFATRSLDPARFDALHAAVAPQGESERWAEIPWQTDLLAARAKAAREQKPLLMWVMDGHPLGCT